MSEQARPDIDAAAARVERGRRLDPALPSWTGRTGFPDTHDTPNAEHPGTYARVQRRDVIELAQRNGLALAATIRRLPSEDLAKRGAHGPTGG